MKVTTTSLIEVDSLSRVNQEILNNIAAGLIWDLDGNYPSGGEVIHLSNYIEWCEDIKNDSKFEPELLQRYFQDLDIKETLVQWCEVEGAVGFKF